MINYKQTIRNAFVLTMLVGLLLVGLWVDINVGYKQITMEQLWEILIGNGQPGLRFTLLELRIPRVLTVMFVGMGLAVSGCVLQGSCRNDMAEPGILGINAGAGLFLAIFLMNFVGGSISTSFLLPFVAFAGSLFTVFLDYQLSRVNGRVSSGRLLLVGIAVSTAASSITTMLMLRMSNSQHTFVQNWLSGSIWGAAWGNLRFLIPGILLLTVYLFYKSRTLNVMVLGDEAAIGLGVQVEHQRFILLFAAVGLSSLCCAVGGGISFIGLVCPHLSRRLIGPNYHVLIPASMLSGGVLMVWSDIIARTLLAPNELAVGIVAAVIGAPYFLYLLMRIERKC